MPTKLAMGDHPIHSRIQAQPISPEHIALDIHCWAEITNNQIIVELKDGFAEGDLNHLLLRFQGR